MATFIKAGFWENLCQKCTGYKGWLNLDKLIESKISPAIDSEGNLIVANSSNDTVSVDPGGTHLVPDFSGMIIVNDHYDGGVETWICGGGDCSMLGHTSASPGNSTFTQAGNGYEWTNVDDLNGPFTFTVVKTRNGA